MPWGVLFLRHETLPADRVWRLVEQPAPERNGDVGQRPAGDVVQWIGLLMHPCSHIAGINQNGGHSMNAKLRRERSGQKFERCLACAVSPPTGIRTLRGVTRHVHDETLALSEQRH